MPEIPESLLRRSAEAKAKALGIPVEQVLAEMRGEALPPGEPAPEETATQEMASEETADGGRQTAAEAEQEAPVAEAEQAEPAAEAEQEEPAAEAEQEEPAAEAEQVEPAAEVEQEEPAAEAEQVEPTAEAEQPEPVAETDQDEPLAAAEQPQPVAGGDGAGSSTPPPPSGDGAGAPDGGAGDEEPVPVAAAASGRAAAAVVARPVAAPTGVPEGVRTQRLLTVVKAKAIQQVKTEPTDKVNTWPHLMIAEFASLLAMTGFLVVLSVILQAPLLEAANFNETPNPSKAPWYFLGLQELLSYFDPQVAGVLVPTFGLIGLMAIPYFDRNPSTKPSDRKFAILMFTFFLAGASVLTLLGVLFRGQGFNFSYPWSDGIFFDDLKDWISFE
jgi:menaquinol-cytochrome c reductase cytochrome b/c subunit